MALRNNPLRRAIRRVPPFAALLFIVSVLLVFNLTNWRMLSLLERSKEDDLSKRLRSVSQIVALSLQSPSVPEILPELATLTAEEQPDRLDEFADSHQFEDLAARLKVFRDRTDLSQVMLLTTQGFVVADSHYRFAPGEPMPFTIDSDVFALALEGKAATTHLYDWEGTKFQRDYQRITTPDGRVVGVLMCAISPDYLESMQLVRGRVLRLWLISSILLIGLGFWLWRTFSYMVRLERTATQATRVEAMGALAAGVAHELRNPLAIIRAMAEEIESEQPAETLSAQNARDIVAETQRLGELVNHFLSLSRAPKSNAPATTVEVREEILRVVQLMRKSAPLRVRFETDLLPASLSVQAEERALRQLLLNLLINASEAVEQQKSGTILVQAREKRQQVEIRVKDNGPGMSSRELSRAFEPFFTTKKSGTGLGLALSRGIVENLGGTLTLESAPGKGTTAVLTLPKSGPSTREKSEEQNPEFPAS